MRIATPATGFRYPYVIGYQGEAQQQRLRFVPRLLMGGVQLAHVDPQPGDTTHGVLRARQRTDRRGRPDFTSVNVIRQWRCMTEGLCQVCEGSAQDQETGRFSWLLSDDDTQAEAGGSVSGFTNAPPTCRACIPEAITSCPHLRRAAAVDSVLACEPYGVLADLFEPRGAAAVLAERNVRLPLSSPYLRFALASQLMVLLHDVRPERVCRDPDSRLVEHLPREAESHSRPR